jgi:hypothetical protein
MTEQQPIAAATLRHSRIADVWNLNDGPADQPTILLIALLA